MIISESKNIFYEIKYSTSSWSESVKSRVKFVYQPMSYPAGRQAMKDLYRPCTTLTLFLASLLPRYDAVIYLDTDSLFFSPPELLWDEFSYFNSSQMIAMGAARREYDKVREKVWSMKAFLVVFLLFLNCKSTFIFKTLQELRLKKSLTTSLDWYCTMKTTDVGCNNMVLNAKWLTLKKSLVLC